ncbi:MAG: radical SAM protein [Armatimonadetes bacterium]|nr:radical SAM protein [Armatimonadota bacterium]
MSKTVVDRDGYIFLPPDYRGVEVVLESGAEGLALWRARPDVRRVYIEVTTRCNLNCAICVRQAWRDRPGEMGWETFAAAMEQLRAFPDLRRITFGGFGEPLAHPRIADMVAAAGSLGVGITLTTNGLLLARPVAEALLEARVDTVVVSVDTAHLRAYEQAHIPHGLDAVLDNVRGLRDLAAARGLMVPRIGLEYVVTRSNVAELSRLPALARDLGASFSLVTNLLPHTPEMAGDILYDRDEPLPVPAGWPLPSGDWLVWGIVRLPRLKWGAWRRCQFVEERSLVIGWDGGVSPCYALMHSYPYYIYRRRKEVSRYVLGRVSERSLVEIWTSEEYVKFRARAREFRYPSCVDCGMACALAARNEDCWGNAPSCADCLWAQNVIRCP